MQGATLSVTSSCVEHAINVSRSVGPTPPKSNSRVYKETSNVLKKGELFSWNNVIFK